MCQPSGEAFGVEHLEDVIAPDGKDVLPELA
jgi:hypothetical protein